MWKEYLLKFRYMQQHFYVVLFRQYQYRLVFYYTHQPLYLVLRRQDLKSVKFDPCC